MHLPDGYTRERPEQTRDLISDEQFYGGADISRVWGADGVMYMACCCRKLSDGVFGFRIFKNGVEEIPYEPFCTGRGELGYNLCTGQLTWTAWDGSEWHGGEIMGAAAYPAPLGLPEIMTFICRRLADPVSQIAQAVRRAAGG